MNNNIITRSEITIDDFSSMMREMQSYIIKLEGEIASLKEKVTIKDDMIAEMQDTWINPNESNL